MTNVVISLASDPFSTLILKTFAPASALPGVPIKVPSASTVNHAGPVTLEKLNALPLAVPTRVPLKTLPALARGLRIQVQLKLARSLVTVNDPVKSRSLNLSVGQESVSFVMGANAKKSSSVVTKASNPLSPTPKT